MLAHHATADLPGTGFATMRDWMIAHARAAELPVLEDAEGRLTVETPLGQMGLRGGDGLALMAAAQDAHNLYMIKNALVYEIGERMPAVAAAIRWSDGGAAGGRPPNFQMVQVIKNEALGTTFIRLTLQAEDLSRHNDAAIHFRLLVPRKGITPEWPTMAANGTTIWPDGPGAPDMPVYTTRMIDPGANTLITDVFLHDGGHTSTWAREILAGEKTRLNVGLVGPSGGGLIDADHLLMAADETGFPAAARLLENLPKTAKGTVLLEATHGGDCGYPIAVPPGVTLRWLARSAGERLVEAAERALPHHAGATIWYAGEKKDARHLRLVAEAAGWGRRQMRISGFWSVRRGR